MGIEWALDGECIYVVVGAVGGWRDMLRDYVKYGMVVGGVW